MKIGFRYISVWKCLPAMTLYREKLARLMSNDASIKKCIRQRSYVEYLSLKVTTYSNPSQFIRRLGMVITLLLLFCLRVVVCSMMTSNLRSPRLSIVVDYAAMSYFRFAVKVANFMIHCHSDDLGKCCLEEVS